ncbi:MAG TPA: hypothetical protein VJT85_00115 [Gemmatimonadaceae bacterium]|nr:hypothetical protein [Gemmatimonadaceae bacterium]
MTFRNVNVHDVSAIAEAIRDLDAAGRWEDEIPIDRGQLRMMLAALLNRPQFTQSTMGHWPNFAAAALARETHAHGAALVAAEAAAVADAMVVELMRRYRGEVG